MARSRILLALDTGDLAAALGHARAVGRAVDGVKLGLEFFAANGPEGVLAVAATAGRPLFLDLKLHDIPATVKGAVGAALRLRPFMLTVHAGGGRAMLEAAVAAAAATSGAERPLVVAVTVLTSLDDEDLAAVGQRGPAADQVRRLAALAQDCGLDGVVCSAREIVALRRQCGEGFRLVVPGVRPIWAAAEDQKRVATPAEAARAGADYLVVGRPILAAPDPAAAAQRIAAELAALPAESEA